MTLSLQSSMYVLIIYDYDYFKKCQQNIISKVHGPFLSVRKANEFRIEEYYKKRQLKGMTFSIHKLENWDDDDICNVYDKPTHIQGLKEPT